MSALAGARSLEPIRERWNILAVALLAQTATAVTHQGLPTLAYFLQRDLSLSRVQVGTFTTSIAVGAALSAIAGGLMADRIGVRWLLLFGQLLIGAAVVATGLAQSYLNALIVLAPAGLGWGLVNPSINKAMMYWFEARVRATAMSIKQTGVPLSGAVAAATLPSLAIAYSWRVAVIALGIGIAVSGVACFLGYREFPKAAVTPGRRSSGGAGLWQVVRNRPIIIVSVAALPLVAIQYSVVTYLVLYFNEVLLFPIVAAAMFLSLTQVGGIGGRVLWGTVSDYVFGGGRRATLIAITVLAALMLAIIAILPQGAPTWQIGVAAVILGLTSLSWHGVYMAQLGELVGKELAGTAAGVNLSIMQLATMGGAPLFGYLVDQSGSYRLAWLVMAAFSLVSAALLGIVPSAQAKE